MKLISLDNDYEMEVALSRKNATTGLLEPATGLTGLTFWLSATDGGATIHATLSVSAAERAGAPGVYSAILQGTDLRTHLASYVGARVWEVFGDGANIDTSIARKVVDPRRP